MKNSKTTLAFICLLFFSSLLLNACSKDNDEPRKPEPEMEEYGATATIEIENGETLQFSTTKDEKGEMMAGAFLIEDEQGVMISLVDGESKNLIVFVVRGSIDPGTYTFNLNGEKPSGAALSLGNTDFFPLEPTTSAYPEIYFASFLPTQSGDSVGSGSLKITSFTDTEMKASFSMTMFNAAGEKVTVSDGKIYCKVGQFNE